MAKKEVTWGLWDTRRKRWKRAWSGITWKFATKGAAQRHKTAYTRRNRTDPMIAYYRAFVVPRRMPDGR